MVFRAMANLAVRRATVGCNVLPRTPLFFAAGTQRFHCQVPCGIFTDDLRVKMMIEDAATIRKAVVQTGELHKSGSLQDIHQMGRWITTKEEHASKIMTTVGDYFMAQKVKKENLTKEEYHEVLAMLHSVMVAAMKTKQSVELGPVDALDAALKSLEPLYTSQ